MRFLGQANLGFLILLLLSMLVVVKRFSTGSVVRDRPDDGVWLWLVHVYNMFFLLVVNPLAGVLLVTRRLDSVDPTRLAVSRENLLAGLEIAGLVVYVAGFLLMAWALVTLRRAYQVGGSAPRPSDAMTVAGPYRLIRHPMYLAALCIALGLTCLTQSLACLAVFCVYLALILVLIPIEERGLLKSYGPAYAAYQSRVRALIPLRRSVGGSGDTAQEVRSD